MYFYDFPKVDVTASIIAHTDSTVEALAILAIRRGKDPFKGKLALPGGFIDPGETLEMTAKREMQEETGLDLDIHRFKQYSVQSEPNRDPRGQVVDHVYTVRINHEELNEAQAGDDAAAIEIVTFSFDKVVNTRYRYRSIVVSGGWLDEWAFDHGIVLKRFLDGVFLGR